MTLRCEGPALGRGARPQALIPAVAALAMIGSTLAIHIGGTTAANEDYSQDLSAKLPLFVAIVVGLAFVLLAIVFRSRSSRWSHRS